MADILPFKAVRFNLNKVSLGEVVCPPYDVISVPEHHRLMASHPKNIVRVEYPLAQGKGDRYEMAGDFWTTWQKQKWLVQDKAPGFYAYEQRFSVGSQTFERRGFFAAVRIERPGVGCVRPHERTFPKHKEDRLKLMRATDANISPIFGLFFDQKDQAKKMLRERMTQKPTAICRDDKGVTHRLWHITDPAAIKVLRAVLKGEDILIADGHHRYETSWNYSKERQKKDRSANPKRAYKYVMTFLCPLDDDGLVIQPTHRGIRSDVPWDEWKKRIEAAYQLKPIDSLNDMLIKLRDPKEKTGMGVAVQGKLYWLKPSTPKATAMPVVYLHETILKDVSLEAIHYGQDPREMVASLQRGEMKAVFLLPPPDKLAFAALCKKGKRLPQKSTYFYPKVGTGFVMRPLAGDV